MRAAIGSTVLHPSNGAYGLRSLFSELAKSGFMELFPAIIRYGIDLALLDRTVGMIENGFVQRMSE